MSEVLTVPFDGLTLSGLLWRRFRRQTPGLRETVLALNPGLAEIELSLPRGATVTLPDALAAPSRTDIVQLWE